MAATNRTFRVFISSTFNDLKAERDALQPVWQYLRTRCAARGAAFEAIDLRWGVSAEAALDQQALPICLNEVQRCRRISPRPNFVVLLSERYGWRPPPPCIPADEYVVVIKHLDDPDARSLVQEWYVCDHNAVPPVYLLRPREASEPDPWVDRTHQAGIERRLRAALDQAAKSAGISAAQQVKFDRSATEQEILEGALSSPDAHEHVFCYFRSVHDLPTDERAAEYRDLDIDGRPDIEAVDRLADLKARLRAHLPNHVRNYETRWESGSVSRDHLGDLAVDVAADLWAVISAQLDQSDNIDDLILEARAHDVFARERSEHFTGRSALLERVANHLVAQANQPLVVVGDSGAGKSALMAEAARRAAAESDAVVPVRFIGVTPESADIRQLLRNLSTEIARAYGVNDDSDELELADVVEQFHHRLGLASADRPLRIFLDGLDQLADIGNARALGWLPASLPEHVHIVVSTTTVPDECLRAASARYDAGQFLMVEPMTPADGARLLSHWLAAAGRTLQPHQASEVLERFAQEGLPLYLKLAYEEARRWHSFDPAERTRLAAGIAGIVRDNLFERLRRDDQHGGLAERALSYLAASKNGLSEDELLEVLSADTEVLSEFAQRSPMSPRVEKLPMIVWSRLFLDLAPYLTERHADESMLLAFYHRQLRDAVETEFLGNGLKVRRHRHLAHYFAAQGFERRSGSDVCANVRALSELPFQQAHGELWDELTSTLTDFDFLERKARDVGVVVRGDGTRVHTGVYQLQEDYALAISRLSGLDLADGRRRVVVTPVDFGDGLELRCPHCSQPCAFREEWRGADIACPFGQCGGPLRVNAFSAGG